MPTLWALQTTTWCTPCSDYNHRSGETNKLKQGSRHTWFMNWGLDSKPCIICWMWGFCSICCTVSGSSIPPALSNEPRSAKPWSASLPKLGSPTPATVVGTIPAGVWLIGPPCALVASTTTIQNDNQLQVNINIRGSNGNIWWLSGIKPLIWTWSTLNLCCRTQHQKALHLNQLNDSCIPIHNHKINQRSH